MSFEYYCTECGEKNSADTVLFNMDALLTQDKNKSLNLLHLAMSEAELKDLINSGTDIGYARECVLTFNQLMQYMSSPMSMGIEELKNLTLEDVETFVGLSNSAASTNFASNKVGRIPHNLVSKGDEKVVEETGEIQYAEAIKLIIKSSTKNMDTAFDKNALKSDFEMILGLFSERKDHTYHFTMKSHTFEDNNGNEVWDGYWINQNAIDNARICKNCRERIFRKAGIAPHRVISFIGDTASGKTSTILSLTHYAQYGLSMLGEGKAEQIWRQNGIVTETRRFGNIMPELLVEENGYLYSDLDWFTQGVAPSKTGANNRADAYHSTMLIKNTDDGHFMILTLMDLPGELFKNGKVNEDKVCNEFKSAFSSSAYIICFDTETNVTIQDVNALMNNACAMQELRLKMTGAKYYIPSMVLFSKADKAKSKATSKEGHKTNLFMLNGEDSDMQGNPVYSSVVNNFNNTIQLKRSFYSIMRCGAYGYSCPKSSDLLEALGYVDVLGNVITEKIGKTSKEELVCQYNKIADKKKTEMPVPAQIDLLMQWILYVSGCLPISQDYETRNRQWEMKNYYLKRPQYRANNPGLTSESDDDIKEGMTRQILFKNPGQWDIKIVDSLSVPGKKILGFEMPRAGIDGTTENIRMRMKQKPDTNAI